MQAIVILHELKKNEQPEEMMSQLAIRSSAITALLAIVIVLPSCGKSSTQPVFNSSGQTVPGAGPGGGVAGNTAPNRGCGQPPTKQGYRPVWIYSHCEETHNFRLNPETENYDGEALGTRVVNKGLLSFKLKDMVNSKISEREHFGIIFMADGHGGGEANWQWMSYSVSGIGIESRLVTQRFDGTCAKHCESSFITDMLQFKSQDEVYQYDCFWDGDIEEVSCTITNVMDPQFTIETTTETYGPYNTLRYLGLGRNPFEGPYPGYDGIVFDIMVTILE